MATYFVASGGSNTAPYDTWAKAATSLQTALTAATANDDIVVIQYDAVPSADSAISADTTYTFAGNILLVSASNDGGSAWTPTPMGATNFIGNSTTSYAITFTGIFRLRISGITLRIAATATGKNFNLFTVDGCHVEWEDCYLWLGSTSGASVFNIGSGSGGAASYQKFKSTTFRFGSTSNRLTISAAVDFEDCTISPDGSAPAVGLLSFSTNATTIRWLGGDVSHMAASTPLVLTSAASSTTVEFDRAKLGTSFVLLGTLSTPLNKANAKVVAYDCSSGDTHGLYAYSDAFGSMTLDSGIYKTGTPSLSSWKIVTTANCSRYTPFVSPWISTYWDATAAITPRLEILRDGSATAYTDAEVWGEFLAKVTASSTRATFFDDAAALNAAGTAQATGVGTGSWTGEGGTAWSGKVDSGAALTPAESGDLSARVFVGVASATVYVNPQIETA